MRQLDLSATSTTPSGDNISHQILRGSVTNYLPGALNLTSSPGKFPQGDCHLIHSINETRTHSRRSGSKLRVTSYVIYVLTILGL